jgi:hypothetical protein
MDRFYFTYEQDGTRRISEYKNDAIERVSRGFATRWAVALPCEHCGTRADHCVRIETGGGHRCCETCATRDTHSEPVRAQ